MIPELPPLLAIFTSKVGNEFAVAVVALALCPLLVRCLMPQTLFLNPKPFLCLQSSPARWAMSLLWPLWHWPYTLF